MFSRFKSKNLIRLLGVFSKSKEISAIKLFLKNSNSSTILFLFIYSHIATARLKTIGQEIPK